ncbi:solute carrier family 26 member 10-like isoform X2 [Thrips palmi]|uniref:Solute carrier family 26 member 10-like isoform X2 n=1 Tax=Thrips palmi TaxID=161013 RepID=A0A6P8ZNM5_THRPL|nr:solute carrier family 26 member 10-like isoform X2 [Thrips palmi]
MTAFMAEHGNPGSPTGTPTPGTAAAAGMYGSTSTNKPTPSPPPTVSLRVDRAVLEQRDLQGRFSYHGSAVSKCSEKEPESRCRPSWCPSCDDVRRVLPRVGAACTARKAADGVRSVFPIVEWLGRYKWREDLVGDLVSGFTVAVMHIPQGLAYALLGNVPPVVGLYMAFFPVLVYCLFGTSRHVSMGTFAVICLMTGHVVTAHTTPHVLPDPADNGTEPVGPLPTNIEVATAVALMVGAVQMLMWALRLGVLSALLSEALVSGFTTAAAIHVLTSQIKDLLGLQLPSSHGGMFKIISQWIAICTYIGTANVAAVVVSLVTMLLLTVNNEALKPWLSRRCALPVPIELLVVIAGTLLSTGPGAPLAVYQLQPLGPIPTGLPVPAVPKPGLLWAVAVESIPIAVVSYTIAMSLALIFATKNGYEVRPNQELLAQGASNLVGSLFSCMPVTASLSRSAVQEAAGCKTQLTSLVSCALLTVVLLWAGPFFQPLPRCVLAAIIVVALRSMLMQVRAAPGYMRNSRWDGSVWLVTFLAVVLVDIDVGLGVGAALSLASLVCQGVRPVCHLLAPLPNTELYVDPALYGAAQRVPGLAIFRYAGVINFATRPAFRDNLYRLVGVNPEKEFARQGKVQQGHLQDVGPAGSTANFVEEMKRQEPSELHAVVLDMSGVVRVDSEGVRTLLRVADDFAKVRVAVVLAAPADNVLGAIVRAGHPADRLRVFPSVHDAVVAMTAAGAAEQVQARV